jgi:hypothetical protein
MDLLQKFQVLQLLSRSSAQHNSARRSNCLIFILDQEKRKEKKCLIFIKDGKKDRSKKSQVGKNIK